MPSPIGLPFQSIVQDAHRNRTCLMSGCSRPPCHPARASFNLAQGFMHEKGWMSFDTQPWKISPRITSVTFEFVCRSANNLPSYRRCKKLGSNCDSGCCFRGDSWVCRRCWFSFFRCVSSQDVTPGSQAGFASKANCRGRSCIRNSVLDERKMRSLFRASPGFGSPCKTS